MDFRTVFTFPFRDPRWPQKIALYSLAFLSTFMLIGYPLTLGYQAAIMRRVRSGEFDGLPEWRLDRQFFADGARMFIASFIWLVPVLILAVPLSLFGLFVTFAIEAVDNPRSGAAILPLLNAIAGWLVANGMATRGNSLDVALGLFISVGIVFQILSTIFLTFYSWTFYAFAPAIMITAVRSGIRDALRPRTLLAVMKKGKLPYVLAIFTPFITGYAAYVGCVFFIVGFFVVLAYGLCLAAYMYGIVWRQYDGLASMPLDSRGEPAGALPQAPAPA